MQYLGHTLKHYLLFIWNSNVMQASCVFNWLNLATLLLENPEPGGQGEIKHRQKRKSLCQLYSYYFSSAFPFPSPGTMVFSFVFPSSLSPPFHTLLHWHLFLHQLSKAVEDWGRIVLSGVCLLSQFQGTVFISHYVLQGFLWGWGWGWGFFISSVSTGREWGRPLSMKAQERFGKWGCCTEKYDDCRGQLACVHEVSLALV